ncbi:spermine synthase [Clostridium thermosuccinogenes]|uniref:Spermine synthase n=1 Tax=Clostridium thermosuccinogenes TaxID=84032 RepID=A0A2K2FNN6_9CLOT|nr:spermine synthase [Pseudoclostridium thermosuccinogenes]PNT98248.1 spermine synthase [Pseudoclostridium thermosuccinogenes]PNU00398.1 spermine synthase [Pseudoclostridium thermosuccinogenes]
MLLSIFFISVSLFVYQVVLTRLYSAVLSYHYVFLTTSFAILGLGIGSIIAYMIRKKGRKPIVKLGKRKVAVNQEDMKGQLNKGSIILAASYIIVFSLNYLLPFVNNMLIYIVLGTIPFLIGGYVYSILFTEFSGISGKLYFADLVGSGVGSVAVIFLLNNAGMFRTVLILSIIALLPALILPVSAKKIKAIGYVLPLILVVGLILPVQYINSIEKNFNGILNNSKKTYGKLIKAGLSPEIVFSEWNAFSRTDVIKIPQKPEDMILTIDGAANAPMYEFDGDVESLKKFEADSGFLPFTIGRNDKTLLIGPGGGRDVLYALARGSKEISAVEINTSSIDAVKAFGEYNGNIYNRPEVKVYGEDGRSFVQRSRDKYDLIFLSLVMTNTSQGMAYALSENYIYTVEAMKDYLNHLSDNGKIAFLAHDEDDLSKIVATAMQALNEKGIPLKDTPDYIALYSQLIQQQHGGVAMHDPVIIIKNKPFTEDESKGLLETAKKNKIAPLYAPLVQEQGPLQQIKEAKISLKDYVNGFKSNVTPATDNRPYFYNFGKGVPATLILILMVVAIGSIIMFTPFAIKSGNFKPTMYFSLLGIGFMMIETPLIQKFILYLGHPTLAFTFVLAALLVGSGIGGYLSNSRLFNRVIGAFYLPSAMVAVISIILLLFLGFIFEGTSGLNLTGRIIVASILVMLQGFFMGMPFPRGLKLIGESKKNVIVPVMWGVNGVTSVIGSVLSVILSMTIGFTGALIAGAVIYLIVSFFKSL